MPQRRGAMPLSDAEVLGHPDTYARGVPYERLERLRAKTPVVWLDGRQSERPGSWAVLSYADVCRALAHPELFAPESDGILHGPATRRHDAGYPAEAAAGGHDDGAGTVDGPVPPAELIDMDPPARAMLGRVPSGEPVDFVTEVAGDQPQTLRNMLAGGLYALLRNPGEYDRLREGGADDEHLLDSAVEEMLRWWTPVIQVCRTVQRGTSMGGVPLRAGERVTLWLASANHDGDAFPEPDRFVPARYVPARSVPARSVPARSVPGRSVPVPRARDGGRRASRGLWHGRHEGRNDEHQERRLHDQPARPHVAFGFGMRPCLGARLARVHLRALLVAVLERPGRVRLAGEPVMLRSSARHGFDRLPIRWTP